MERLIHGLNVPELISFQSVFLLYKHFLWIHWKWYIFSCKGKVIKLSYIKRINHSNDLIIISFTVDYSNTANSTSACAWKQHKKVWHVKCYSRELNIVNWLKKGIQSVKIWKIYFLYNVSWRKLQQQMFHPKSFAPSFSKGTEIAPSKETLSKWFKRRKESC